MSFKKLIKPAAKSHKLAEKSTADAENAGKKSSIKAHVFKKKAGMKKTERVSGLTLLKQPSKVLLATKYSNKLGYNELISAESAIGKTLFGPVPAGYQREFFEYKKNVWVWHENWTDSFDQTHETTIRYEVRPDGVYKKPTGGMYEKIAGKELDNFVTAARSYFDLVKKKLYN